MIGLQVGADADVADDASGRGARCRKAGHGEGVNTERTVIVYRVQVEGGSAELEMETKDWS